MRLVLIGALLSASFVTVPQLVIAQDSRQTATTTVAAPVYASPNDRETPLRVARAGSVLALIEINGEWCHIEFQDPDLGRRSGYVQTRMVRIDGGATVRVNEPDRQTKTTPTNQQGSEQRGDFSVGYVFLHYSDSTDGVSYNLPLGIAASDAWRINRNVDFVLESQYAHGNVDVLVTNAGVSGWSLFGGPRFWGGSRYGQNVRAFGQVVGGVLVEKATIFGAELGTDVGWGIQPGGGVEVPVSRTIAIRPQFDVVIGRVAGVTETDSRFNVNVVFRLFKQ